MTYKGHLAIGYAFSFSPLFISEVREYVLNNFNPLMIGLSFVLVYFFSLLPDLDEPNAYLSKKFPWNIISIPLSFFVTHRGITHTLIFSFVFPTILAGILYFTGYFYKYWIFVLISWLAYISHLVGDSLTRSGVKWFYPLNKKSYRLLPKKLTFKTGSLMEGAYIFMFLLLFGYELYLLYSPYFKLPS